MKDSWESLSLSLLVCLYVETNTNGWNAFNNVSSLNLLCFRYDLESEKLYAISWYKDHEEFYRFLPRGEPAKHSYHVEGVKVDVSKKCYCISFLHLSFI